MTAQTNPLIPTRWQLLALQVLWIAVTLICVGYLVLVVPDYRPFFHGLFVSHDGILTQIGLPATLRADFFPALHLVWLIVFMGTGLVIFWRKPRDPFAIYISLAL